MPRPSQWCRVMFGNIRHPVPVAATLRLFVQLAGVLVRIENSRAAADEIREVGLPFYIISFRDTSMSFYLVGLAYHRLRLQCHRHITLRNDTIQGSRSTDVNKRK